MAEDGGHLAPAAAERATVTSMTALSMTEVTKSYGRTVALSDFSIGVEPGEIVGLLGENGAGKTTAMRTLLGYLNAEQGEVAVLGQSPRDPATRARIGYLPGDFRLVSNQRVSTVLKSFDRLRGGCWATETQRLVAALELDTSRKFGQLSKGNRQKVGVVAALMHAPDVLVLDEPTSGLDPVAQRTVLELVDARRDVGAAVLFSSHILSEVEDIADRVTILRKGHKVAEGTTTELGAAALQTIDVVLDTPPPADVFDACEGVTLDSLEGVKASFRVAGSAAAVMSALAPYGIARIDTGRHDLDAVFYGYYSAEGGDDHGTN